MVIFSPDGKTAYVNHSESTVLARIDVERREVTDRIDNLVSGFSPNLAASPDGEEVWLTHKDVGMITVVATDPFAILTVLDSGPTTNHVNFVTKEDAGYAYVTVGGMDQTLVYRRDGANPELTATIDNSGSTPHGIWPSPDNTRVYVGLETADAVDVIDTDTHEVVATIPVGQQSQALVYVANAVPEGAGTDNLSDQGLNLRIETFEVQPPAGGMVKAYVRELMTTDQIDVMGRELPRGETYTVFVGNEGGSVAITDLVVMPDGKAAATATTVFFDQYDRFLLVPKGQIP